MMNAPQFFIFGVPDGFNLYNATSEREAEFQLFYDNMITDKKRFVIHRKEESNAITYVYLRYNMLSCKSRPGSFLGLALEFGDGYYCTDIQKLLKLFDEIYEAVSAGTAASFLTKENVSQEFQAKYLVPTFADRVSSIIKIEEILTRKIQSWDSSCFAKVDNTFLLGKGTISIKDGLTFDTKSEHINAALKSAGWVYLSDLGTGPEPKLEPEPVPQDEPEPGSGSGSGLGFGSGTNLKHLSKDELQSLKKELSQISNNLKQYENDLLDGYNQAGLPKNKNVRPLFELKNTLVVQKENLKQICEKAKPHEKEPELLQLFRGDFDPEKLLNRIDMMLGRISILENSGGRRTPIPPYALMALGAIAIIVALIVLPKNCKHTSSEKTDSKAPIEQLGQISGTGESLEYGNTSDSSESHIKFEKLKADYEQLKSKINNSKATRPAIKTLIEQIDSNASAIRAMYIPGGVFDASVFDQNYKEMNSNMNLLDKKIEAEGKKSAVSKDPLAGQNFYKWEVWRNDSREKSGTQDGTYTISTMVHFKVVAKDSNGQKVKVRWDWATDTAVRVHTKGVNSKSTLIDEVEFSIKDQGRITLIGQDGNSMTISIKKRQ